MAYFPVELISHTKKVCSLYKRALRNLDSWYPFVEDYRYHATLMRQRFEENRHVQDMRLARKLLEDGEKELESDLHPQPKKFIGSPGGISYERSIEPPDWVLDYWHPLEKAQYPHYFARRELRKKQFIEMWERQYGKPSASDSSHH